MVAILFMNIYIFYDEKIKNGTVVIDFFKSIEKNEKHFNEMDSFLRHSFLNKDKIDIDGRIIKGLGQYCFDGKEVFEYRRKFSKLLIRLFFVLIGSDVLFFGFLDKEDKKNYNKRERENVRKYYNKQISFTKECYKEYGKNLNKFIKFKSYD